MRFSVICTNFNKQEYLEECIVSVLNQDFQDFEFIIVDDCSTDKSLDIINSYLTKTNKIKLIKNNYNIGMAGGYNKAFTLSKGEIVSLIDSDDFWYPNKLSKVDSYFRSNSNCVMHQHLLNIYNFTNKTSELSRPYFICGDLVAYINETKLIPLFVVTTGLSFIAKVLKDVLPIPLEFSKNGEAFLTRTVICFGNVGVTYEELGAYRRHDSNIVFGNPNFDSSSYIENILKPKLNDFYKERNIPIYFAPTNQKSNNSKDAFVKRIKRKLKKLFF